MNLSLVIMAAGVGSRYGGNKQLDPVGPNHEAMLEYAIFDAIQAGFNHIVFVTRPELESIFQEQFIQHLPSSVTATIAIQETPENRTKPYGTGHALLAAKSAIQGSFAVINADDYYGPSAYKLLAEFLNNNDSDYALVGYQLKKTLTPHGSVSRGICEVNKQNHLASIVEHTKIFRDDKDQLLDLSNPGHSFPLSGNETVSLNLWGFQPSFLAYLESQFQAFLRKNHEDPKAEFYLPQVVDSAINDEDAVVHVLHTEESWFGVTYKEDLSQVQKEIQLRIASDVYPNPLWPSKVLTS